VTVFDRLCRIPLVKAMRFTAKSTIVAWPMSATQKLSLCNVTVVAPAQENA